MSRSTHHDSIPAALRQNTSDRQHVLTVGLEDYFHVGAFQKLIDPRRWDRFESRIERSTRTTLQLLDRYDTKATFFVLGWVAEHMPELVREVCERGHEVASRGYYHRSVRDLDRSEFTDDLTRTREAIESATGQRVLGYRVADGWLEPNDLWALEVLADEGYAYDSSIFPRLRNYRGEPWRSRIHTVETPTGTITEVPPSTLSIAGISLPIAGGNYYRQIPHSILKRLVSARMRAHSDPFVMYFHTWELDPEQPRISAGGTITQVRHYRNLSKMRWVLEDYLQNFHFGTVSDFLGLSRAPVERFSMPARPACDTEQRASVSTIGYPHRLQPVVDDHDVGAKRVTIVIPCYNEEASLPFLARTLTELEFKLQPVWSPEFLFVDDASTDSTWDVLNSLFGPRSNCRLLRQPVNGGVSNAILTGIGAADTDIVCSMDCDCSYDPLELAAMLPLLVDGVDLVTASPYHPDGGVLNVPGWRLGLSRGLSALYRSLFSTPLHTWTSCFRVYRRTAIQDLPLREGGFLGTAELVAHLCLRGSRIVEYPATLSVRIFGESKMKTVRTIRGHLRLLGRFLMQRMRTRRLPDSASYAVRRPIETPSVNHNSPPRPDSSVERNGRDSNSSEPLEPASHV